MKRILVVACIVTLFNRCNNNGWSAADKQKGMESCVTNMPENLSETQKKKICSCALEKLMNKYSSYSAANKDASNEAYKVGQECANQVLAGKTGDDDNNGGLFGKKKNNNTDINNEDNGGDAGNGWSNADKNGFIQPCETGLMQNGYSSNQASQLCNCMVEKLQKRYSSLQEANNKGGEAAGAKVRRECENGDDN